VFEGYGLTPEEAAPVVAAIRADPKRWVDFMMRYELGLEEPDPRRALRSAATIAASYVIGGLIPLSPYMAVNSVTAGLWVSVALTLFALFFFGYVKGSLTGIEPLRGAVQTVVIGGLAGGAAFGLARAIS
jgi:VIT1/CCC1 family predicted Fe2+/Mn2+ transporter